jgi:hypothetical protein
MQHGSLHAVDAHLLAGLLQLHTSPQDIQRTSCSADDAERGCLLPAAPPPPLAGPPLQPLVPLNILDASGNPVRNDNTSNFAYVGPNDGAQQAPEVYTAFRPANTSDPTPIQPGETTQLRNTQTGLYCRLDALPAGLVAPSTCITQGVICDQPTIATATILTYTGSGMSYNGVPLVETAPTGTLVLSADPTCAVANGSTLSFPPAALCESPAPSLVYLPSAALPAALLPVMPGCAAPALSCAMLLQHCLSVQPCACAAACIIAC